MTTNYTANDLEELDPVHRILVLRDMASGIWQSDDIRATLAVGQAILESGILREHISGLARFNNLFGIKGHGTDGTTAMNTREVMGGKSIMIKAGFACNKNLHESFQQHYNLLHIPRYQRVLEAKTIEKATTSLVLCGYATDPLYASKLMSIISKRVI